MSDDMISQEEIDALLNGGLPPAGGDAPAGESADGGGGPAADAGSDDSSQFADVLSDIEKDALGEIGNISMGSAATTLSVLLGHKVNITTPTAADLQMSNPYAASQDLKSNYNMWKAAGQIPGCYAIMMQPKKKSPIKSLYLYIDNKTSMLRNIHVKMNDGNAYTITLTNYKTGVSVNASTFTFDKSQVPKGTEVVDLR